MPSVGAECRSTPEAGTSTYRATSSCPSARTFSEINEKTEAELVMIQDLPARQEFWTGKPESSELPERELL